MSFCYDKVTPHGKVSLLSEALRSLEFCKKGELIHDKYFKDCRVFLDDWIGDFEEEGKNFTSIGVFVQVKLAEAQEIANSLPEPNIFMTSLCCDFLEKLIPTFGEYSSLVYELHQHLVSSIFVRKNVLTEDYGQSISTYHSFCLFLKKKVQKLKLNRDAFVTQRRSILQKAEKHKKLLNHSILGWQLGLVGNYFRAWVTYIQSRKWKLKNVHLLFDRYWKEEDRLRWYFGQWTEFLHVLKHCRLMAKLANGTEECITGENDVNKKETLLIEKKNSIPQLRQQNEQLAEKIKVTKTELDELNTSMLKCKETQTKYLMSCMAWQNAGISTSGAIICYLKNILQSYVCIPDIETELLQENVVSGTEIAGMSGSDLCLAWLKHQLLKIYNLNTGKEKFFASILRQKVVASKDIRELAVSDYVLDLCRAIPDTNPDLKSQPYECDFGKIALGYQKNEQEKEVCASNLSYVSICARNSKVAVKRSRSMSSVQIFDDNEDSNDKNSRNVNEIVQQKHTAYAFGPLASPQELCQDKFDGIASTIFVAELMQIMPLIKNHLTPDDPNIQQLNKFENLLSDFRTLASVNDETKVEKTEPTLAEISHQLTQTRRIDEETQLNISTAGDIIAKVESRYSWANTVDAIDKWAWDFLGEEITASEKALKDEHNITSVEIQMERVLQEYGIKKGSLLFSYFLRNDVRRLHQVLLSRYMIEGGETLSDLAKETAIISVFKAKAILQKIRTKHGNEEIVLIARFILEIAGAEETCKNEEYQKLLDELHYLHTQIIESGVLERISLTDEQKTRLLHFYAAECGSKTSLLPRRKWILFVEKYQLLKEPTWEDTAKDIFQRSLRFGESLCFTEFCTAISGIAAIKYPDPFLSDAVKTESILEHLGIN